MMFKWRNKMYKNTLNVSYIRKMAELPTCLPDKRFVAWATSYTPHKCAVFLKCAQAKSTSIQRLLHLYKHRQRDSNKIINVRKVIFPCDHHRKRPIQRKICAVSPLISHNHNSFITYFQIQKHKRWLDKSWMTLAIRKKAVKLMWMIIIKWLERSDLQTVQQTFELLTLISLERKRIREWACSGKRNQLLLLSIEFRSHSIFPNEIKLFRIPNSDLSERRYL